MAAGRSIQEKDCHNEKGKENVPLSDSSVDTSKGVFVYGTLMAEELLSWLLTGSSDNSTQIIARRQPAVLRNYRRVPVKHGDYPALIPGTSSDQVTGYLILPQSASELRKIDDFEGETYSLSEVSVTLLPNGKELKNKRQVRAQVYVWAGNMDAVWQDREWSFLRFREKRLGDWLDLFDGMEMVG